MALGAFAPEEKSKIDISTANLNLLPGLHPLPINAQRASLPRVLTLVPPGVSRRKARSDGPPVLPEDPLAQAAGRLLATQRPFQRLLRLLPFGTANNRRCLWLPAQRFGALMGDRSEPSYLYDNT